MAIRCKCGMFLKKETNTCSRCKIEWQIMYDANSNMCAHIIGNKDVYSIIDNRIDSLPKTIQKPKEETKMSFFQFDPSKAGNVGFDPVPAGEYEVIISEAKVDIFKSGNRGIKVTLTIRDDVDQQGGKRKVFDNFVEVPDAAFKFQNLAKGLEWAEGETVDTLEDYAAKIQFATVRAKFKVTAATAQYAAKNEVVTYLPTQAASHSGGGFGGQDPFVNDGKPIDISDDDLPF